MIEIFQFDYQLEMYKPAGARRWGYWAMPILYGDRLIGKVDATTDNCVEAVSWAAQNLMPAPAAMKLWSLLQCWCRERRRPRAARHTSAVWFA
jgi:uncharacterized protein YcaQ